mmetsp:Transcript_18471/g.23518  ORF Transcript_18471/g.23518 Transcript_18471/m.23518 type:complete len:524 (+) Transcript_18471:29-1600(+)
MEEHILLRVPEHLRDRIKNVINPIDPTATVGEEMKYVAENSRDFIFIIGEDQYYATLIDLPCIVETQKTMDQVSYYKTGDIGQMLLVHNARVGEEPRPGTVGISPGERKFAAEDGLTPPMKEIKTRFGSLHPPKDVDPEILGQIDKELVDLEADLVKRERSTDEHAKPFEYEELIDMEPYMYYWDDVTTLERGEDNFVASAKAAYDLAYERYEQDPLFEQLESEVPPPPSAPAAPAPSPSPSPPLENPSPPAESKSCTNGSSSIGFAGNSISKGLGGLGNSSRTARPSIKLMEEIPDPKRKGKNKTRLVEKIAPPKSKLVIEEKEFVPQQEPTRPVVSQEKEKEFNPLQTTSISEREPPPKVAKTGLSLMERLAPKSQPTTMTIPSPSPSPEAADEQIVPGGENNSGSGISVSPASSVPSEKNKEEEMEVEKTEEHFVAEVAEETPMEDPRIAVLKEQIASKQPDYDQKKKSMDEFKAGMDKIKNKMLRKRKEKQLNDKVDQFNKAKEELESLQAELNAIIDQ